MRNSLGYMDHTVSVVSFSTLLWHEINHTHYVNPCAWLYSNKTLFTKTGSRQDMPQGSKFADSWFNPSSLLCYHLAFCFLTTGITSNCWFNYPYRPVTLIIRSKLQLWKTNSYKMVLAYLPLSHWWRSCAKWYLIKRKTNKNKKPKQTGSEQPGSQSRSGTFGFCSL